MNTSYADEESKLNLPINEQRKIYLEIVLRNRIDAFKLRNNVVAVERKKAVQNWLPLDKRIEAGEKDIYNEQIKDELNQKKSDCDKYIEHYQKIKKYYQEKLDELNKTGNCSVNFNVDYLFMPTEERHELYVLHCHTIDYNPNNALLKTVLDNMLGQALRYFIDNCEE